MTVHWFNALTTAQKIATVASGLFLLGLTSGMTASGVVGWPDRITANAVAVQANSVAILRLQQDMETIFIAQALNICERRREEEVQPVGSLQTCIVNTRSEIRALQQVLP